MFRPYVTLKGELSLLNVGTETQLWRVGPLMILWPREIIFSSPILFQVKGEQVYTLFNLNNYKKPILLDWIEEKEIN